MKPRGGLRQPSGAHGPGAPVRGERVFGPRTSAQRSQPSQDPEVFGPKGSGDGAIVRAGAGLRERTSDRRRLSGRMRGCRGGTPGSGHPWCRACPAPPVVPGKGLRTGSGRDGPLGPRATEPPFGAGSGRRQGGPRPNAKTASEHLAPSFCSGPCFDVAPHDPHGASCAELPSPEAAVA